MYKQFKINFDKSYQVKDLLKNIKKNKIDIQNDGVKLSKKYDNEIVIDCDSETKRVLIRFTKNNQMSTIAINPIVIEDKKIKQLDKIDSLSQLFYDGFLSW